MDKYKSDIIAASEKIEKIFTEKPEFAIILGSGLSSLADDLTETAVISYSEIPGFPEITVAGHDGLFIYGKLKSVPVVVLKGRFHYYEGHSIDDVVFPVRVLVELGIKTLVITNAAGGINNEFSPGDIMIIKDHVGLFCESPLRGKNYDEYGPRFPDQSYIYDYKNVLKIANSAKIPVKEGIYFYAKGPAYETPAEIYFMKTMGADAVGMSTVPEAVIASHGGLRVIGISCITNYAAGIFDIPLSHDEVLEIGKKGSEKIKLLINEIVKKDGGS